MNSRQKILGSLLVFDKPVVELKQSLSELSWDHEGVVVLKPDHIGAVLERFVAGRLLPDEVEEWANLIECREDIDFDSRYEELLGRLVFELANPALTQKLDQDSAERWLARLSSAAASG